MSLSSETARNNYTGNNSNSVYAYSFKIFDENNLTITVRDTDGAEVPLTKTTDYTVSGVGEGSGGNVTLVDNSQDWLTGGNLKSGYELAIIREVDLVQSTDIRNQGSFYPETHEDALDYLTMIDQQQQDQIDRSMRLPNSVDPADFDMKVPYDISDYPGSAIIVNEDGDGLTVSGPISGVPLYYHQSARPAIPPAGTLAFWKDTSVNQWKIYDHDDEDWRMFA